MVHGKPSNWSARQMDIPSHSPVEIGILNLCCNNYGCREGRARCSRGEWRCPWTGMRSKRLLESDSLVLQACVLGLPLQGWKFDSESSVSRRNWDCLIPLPHRVRSGTKRCLIWLDEINFLNHICVDRCIPRMVNTPRIWKLKFNLRTYSFWLFSKSKPRTFLSLACLDKGLLYTFNQISLVEY